MKNAITIHFSLFCLLLIFTAFTGSAWAVTASNTQIINNASLSYNDGTGPKTVNAIPVVVTVSLLPGTPIVTKGPDQTTPYVGPNTPLVNTFTIIASNTNGPDNYSLTPAIIATTNAAGSGVTLTSPASPVKLGATVVLSGSTTVLNVPSDGNLPNAPSYNTDGEVNGIAVGDWIVLNGDTANPRQVTAITDPASGTATITVGSAFASAPAAGQLVAEQKTVTVTVNSGTITTIGQNIVITKQLTIASTTDPAKTANTSATPTTDTYTSGLATLTKYVRNVTAVPTMTGTGTKYTYNAIDYWPSGITAKPGEVLEYILVATNSGTGSVTAAALTDTLPTNYVSLRTGAYSGSTDITYFNESGTASYLTAAPGDDAATYASPTLTVNVGTGATNSACGTIASGATVRVLYRVTVNP
jgi:hypothetical protein